MEAIKEPLHPEKRQRCEMAPIIFFLTNLRESVPPPKPILALVDDINGAGP